MSEHCPSPDNFQQQQPNLPGLWCKLWPLADDNSLSSRSYLRFTLSEVSNIPGKADPSQNPDTYSIHKHHHPWQIFNWTDSFSPASPTFSALLLLSLPSHCMLWAYSFFPSLGRRDKHRCCIILSGTTCSNLKGLSVLHMNTKCGEPAVKQTDFTEQGKYVWKDERSWGFFPCLSEQTHYHRNKGETKKSNIDLRRPDHQQHWVNQGCRQYTLTDVDTSMVVLHNLLIVLSVLTSVAQRASGPLDTSSQATLIAYVSHSVWRCFWSWQFSQHRSLSLPRKWSSMNMKNEI